MKEPDTIDILKLIGNSHNNVPKLHDQCMTTFEKYKFMISGVYKN